MSHTPESHSPSVLRMTAPLVISFAMRGAFTLVDTIYAATLGDEAVAAVGLTVPFEFLMIALWVGLSTGVTSCLSRAMGARQGDQIRQYLRVTLRLVAIVSPLFALIGVAIAVFAPHVGLSEEVARSFRIYGTTMVAGGALTSFWSILPDSIVKAHQDTRATMWAGIISNVINVSLNTVFVFVFEWGVFGIALSTVIGRIGGLAYALIRARAHERRRTASGRDTVRGEDPAPYRSILALALPSSLTFALMAGETAVVNGFLASMDHPTEAIAAYSIFHRVMLFAFNPIIAASVALLPYTARHFGTGDLPGVRRAFRQVSLASLAYCVLLVGPLILPAAPWIAASLAESPVTADYTTLLLRLVPLACLLGAPFLLSRPVFEGMQRGRPGLVMATTRYLVLTPVAAWLGVGGARLWGHSELDGLVVALLAVSAVTSVTFWIWLRRALRERAGDA